MIPEIGNVALMLALILAMVQFSLPAIGVFKKNDTLIALAKPAALAQCMFVMIAFACLIDAFIHSDFSVSYVMQHSDESLPLFYRIGAVWGGHEGSLLLWVLMLNLWTLVLCVWSSKRLSLTILALVLSVLACVDVGFLTFILHASNPFLRDFSHLAVQGQDLNPVLQDPGLMIHPPMLYLGYVGFVICFAFAIAGLLLGTFDQTWASWCRPWALLSWSFLTIGIVLGSWWAYHELGWGGWWFWDPVENASFLPWLVGTALIHSLVVTEKRNAFQAWTILLAIIGFALSLLGTFLVRSGVLISVHSFASDPRRGIFLLSLLGIVLLLSLGLFAWRAPKLRHLHPFHIISRETFLLGNTVLLLVLMTTVLFGTLYPLILDSLGLGQLSVGVPYFNAVFVPLSIPIFVLMCMGPICYWHKMPFLSLMRKVANPFVISLLAGGLLPWSIRGVFNIWVMLGVALACWIALTSTQSLRKTYKQTGKLKRRHIAMFTAHMGIAVCMMGVTIVSQASLEKDVRMSLRDAVTLGKYSFTFYDLDSIDGPNYTGVEAQFKVSERGRPIGSIYSEKRIYHVTKMAMTEAGIDAGVFYDLYVALGESLGDGSWSVRIYYKPFIRWIWFGGFLIMLGGFLAIGRQTFDITSEAL